MTTKSLSALAAHFDLLGKSVQDRVTKFKGVCTSISFDLYGCIQATVDAGFNAKQEREAHWFDIARLTVLDAKRVMPLPEYLQETATARGGHGAAEKSVGR